MPVDPTAPPGSDKRVGDLDPANTEGGVHLATPTRSFDSPANVNSVIESMAGLRLHADEAQASEGTQPHDFNYPRLEH
jgi:hypothetical protein